MALGLVMAGLVVTLAAVTPGTRLEAASETVASSHVAPVVGQPDLTGEPERPEFEWREIEQRFAEMEMAENKNVFFIITNAY